MNYTVRNLLVASALMLVGILAVTSFIRAERQQLSRDKQEVQVLVATKDIPAGTSAKELEAGGYLDTTEVLREDAPDSAIGKMSTIKGLVSNETIYKGEILTERAFDKTQGLAPTHQIKGNERLFTVPILAANDVGGLIKPGDHVDIAATLGDNEDQLNTILARDVEVIETPESLRPASAEADPEAPDAEGATKLYVLKATDREARNIQFGLSRSDEHQLFMWLRPSNGATETKLDPMYGPIVPRIEDSEVPVIKGGGVTNIYGPDTSVR